jgi:hypothetical protein
VWRTDADAGHARPYQTLRLYSIVKTTSEKLNSRKGGPVTRFVFRMDPERDCDQIDEDQNDEKPIDRLADAVANRPCSAT